jgi:hypothetical protein
MPMAMSVKTAKAIELMTLMREFRDFFCSRYTESLAAEAVETGYGEIGTHFTYGLALRLLRRRCI